MAKTEFVSKVLNAIDADFFVIGSKDSSSQAVSIDVTSSRNKQLLSTLKEHLSSNPLCETLCLKIVVAYHVFGRCEFVTDSIWWIAIKQWKTKQQSKKCAKVMNGYLAGLNWLRLQGLDASEYLKSA